MRFVGAWAAVLALGLPLGACQQVDASKSGTDSATTADQPSLGSDYDYRLAFRLPPSRISQTQDAHVRACDQLGPARCRVTTVRYHVSGDNQVSAILSLMLDPTIAQTFGRAAAQTVSHAGGLMIDSQMVGGQRPDAAARAGNVVVRLRGEIADIDTQLRTALTDQQRAAAIDKQNRLKAAVQTIGELDQGALQGTATSPVLLTYASGTTLPVLGGSTSATFDSAGETFLSSLASLAQVLAGVGPWILVLLGGALILRRLIPVEEPAPPREVGVPMPKEEHDNRNVIQRLFGREEHHEDVHEPVN